MTTTSHGPPAAPAIEFWFDYISHNAYLAWHRVQNMASAHGRPLRAEPVLFAGLLNHYGGKGPAEVPEKNRWMLRNVLRKAALNQIPIRPPASHPFNPLLLLRCTLGVAEGPQRNALVSALFHSIWAEGADPAAASTIEDAARRSDLDAAVLLEQAATPDIKDILQLQTRRAIAKGIFGVPSLLSGKELFWGYDDLDYLELHLQGRDPLAGQSLSAWNRVKPSARRQG